MTAVLWVPAPLLWELFNTLPAREPGGIANKQQSSRAVAVKTADMFINQFFWIQNFLCQQQNTQVQTLEFTPWL